MLERRNLHLKVQEMCDCYAGTDYLKEICLVPKEEDIDEAAVKWIALAVLHGLSANVEKIKLSCGEDGEIAAVAEYRRAPLPSPGREIGRRVLEAIRQITHFEKDKEKGPLALGIRNDSVELTVEVKRKEGEESVTLKFPR